MEENTSGKEMTFEKYLETAEGKFLSDRWGSRAIETIIYVNYKAKYGADDRDEGK